MIENIVRINDLTISFNKQVVVNKIAFGIEKGKTTAIVGESGSGKSVTAMSVLGLLPKTASVFGNILFEGENLLSFTEKALRSIRGRKISMIFQEPMTSLNPVFTIGEQIGEVILLHNKLSHKGIRAKTCDMLQEVGISSERIGDYPHEFSGGMRQRVMIAMALANEPLLLIADEPTTALDATTSKQIVKLLYAVKEHRNMSMLFISHDLGVVSSIADDICVMNAGAIVESGKTSRVLQSPENQYTRALLACRPTIPS